MLRNISIILALLLITGLPVYAQDTQDSVAEDEADVSLEEAEDFPGIPEVDKGAYWWAEPDAAAIAALNSFGVDVVSIRYGFGDVVASEEPGHDGEFIGAWNEGGDPSILTEEFGLPTYFEYRLSIEVAHEVYYFDKWIIFADWLRSEIDTIQSTTDLDIHSIELVFPMHAAGTYRQVDLEIIPQFFEALDISSIDIPIELGLNPHMLIDGQGTYFDGVTDFIDGFVVYFMDYDYSGVSPRITDRQWIDYTAAMIEGMGVPFTAVIPVVNRAIWSSSIPMSTPYLYKAVDIELLMDHGELRQMGAAGSEIVLTSDIPDTSFRSGDKFRILKSIDNINIEEVVAEIPEIAPGCSEVSLYRFPLVPGFDPEISEVLGAAGWIAVQEPQEEMSPEELEKQELDQKSSKMQQIIWMITMGLMAVVLMRMFSRGAGKQGDGGGGGGGGGS